MGDSELVVLVHIEEAHGLYLRKEKVFVNASLGGLTLQTEAVVPTKNTIFDFNIIWETDKNTIKRMKTENLPIKLECFSTNGTARHPIGFVIIPIRGVPVVSGENRQKLQKAVPTWHKLIGVSSEWRALKPEISIYCTITDPENVHHLDLERDLKSYKFVSTSNMLSSHNGLFIELNEVGQYIQLGNGPDDVYKFAVHINLISISGLTRKSEEHQFHIKYVLFGSPSEDRRLVRFEDEDRFSVQEKITINCRASLTTIREYFNDVFYIPLDVLCNDTIIGFVKFSIDLPSLIDTTQVQGLVHHVLGECAFSSPSPDITLSYEFRIDQLPAKEPIPISLSAIRNSIDNDVVAAGAIYSARSKSSEHDALVSEHLNELPKDAATEYEEAQTEENVSNASVPQTVSTIPHRTFRYKIVLNTIEISRNIEIGIWQLSLQHGKAHSSVTISNVSVREEFRRTLSNIELELYFSAKLNEIREILKSEACVMNIKGPHGFFGTAKLDNGTLLSQQDEIGIILMENESAEQCAIVQAYAVLEDLGTNLNVSTETYRSATTNPKPKPHLDEDLAYKMVEELEAWKTQQQDMFLVELKQREAFHLAQITSEWTKKRTELEAELTHKVEQCNQLTDALQEASQIMKKSQEDDAVKHRQFYVSSVEKERALRLQVLRLQEDVRSTKIDSEHALKLANLKYDDACKKFESLEQVHGHCRRFIADLEKEVNALRLRSDENETMSVLVDEMKSKLSREQSSKHFFKQKWTDTKQQLESLRLQILTRDDRDVDNSLSDAILSEKAHLVNEQQELQSITDALEHL